MFFFNENTAKYAEGGEIADEIKNYELKKLVNKLLETGEYHFVKHVGNFRYTDANESVLLQCMLCVENLYVLVSFFPETDDDYSTFSYRFYTSKNLSEIDTIEGYTTRSNFLTNDKGMSDVVKEIREEVIEITERIIQNNDFEYAEGGRVGYFDLVYQRWSKIMGGDGVSGTIRTKPANYYVATVLPDGTLRFDDLEANTRDVIDKEKVKELWSKNLIPSENRTYAKGGEIKNQYENMAASEVWNAWSDEQRRHFLHDHNIKTIHPTKVMEYSFSDLPPDVKQAIVFHKVEGQYADGGKIATVNKRISAKTPKSLVVVCSAVGNPDFGQNPYAPFAPTQIVPVTTLREAQSVVNNYINDYDLGGGNWTGGQVFHPTKGQIAIISYNGRVWHLPESKNDYHGAEYSKDMLDYDYTKLADGGSINSDNTVTVYRFNPMLIFKGGGYPIKSVSPTEWHIDKSKAMDFFNTFNHTLIAFDERIEMMESNDGDTDADSNVWILAAVEAAIVSQADYDDYLKDTSNDEIIGNAADYDFVTVAEKKFMPNGTKVPAKLYKSIYADGGEVSGKIQIGANVHFIANDYPKSEGYYGIVQRNVNHPQYSVDVYKNKKRILSDVSFKNTDMKVIQPTQAIVLVISNKKPLYTQLNKLYPDNTFLDIEHESNPHLMFSPSMNKYIIVFTNSYLQQVDKNVVKDNLDYIKKTYGVSRITWANKEAKKSAYAEMMYANGGKIDMKEHLCGCGMNFGEGGNIPEFNEQDFTKVMYRYITKKLVPFGIKTTALNKFTFKGKDYELAAWNKFEDTEKGRIFTGSEIMIHEMPSTKAVGSAYFDPDTVTLEFEIDGLEIEFTDKHHLPFEVDKTTLMKYPVKIWVNGTRDINLELSPKETFAEANYKAHQIWKSKRFSDLAYHIEYSDGEVFSGYIDLEPNDFHQPHNRRILSNHLTILWGNIAKLKEPKFPITKEEIEEAKEALKKYAFNDAVPLQYAHIIEYDEYQIPNIRLSSPDALENKEVRQATNWLIVNEGFTTYQINLIMEFVAPDDVLKQIKAEFTKFKNQIALMRDELAYPAMPYDGKEYAKGGEIETDTSILTNIIAEGVAYEVLHQKYDSVLSGWGKLSDAEKKQVNKETEKLKIKVINYLTKRANDTYKNNESFAKKVRAKGNKGRDYLQTMMMHWAGFHNGKMQHDINKTINNYKKLKK